jgi:hypothetical protein
MKLGDIDWSKVPKNDIYLVQHKNSGNVYNCSQYWLDERKDKLTILAKRPEPPLTKEQIEAVREYDPWIWSFARFDQWLKQRGGE